MDRASVPLRPWSFSCNSSCRRSLPDCAGFAHSLNVGFWLKVTIAYALLAGALVLALGFDLRTGLELLLLVLAFLPAAVKHSPRLYLWLSQIKYWILNKETTWDLSLQFRGNFVAERVDRFVHRLALEQPGETEVKQASATRFIVRYRRLFTVEFSLGPGYEAIAGIGDELPGADGLTTLDIVVYEQQVSYRRSRGVLEDVLIPFAEQLKDEFTPQSASFSLRVRFDRGNPFFGLYLERLRPDLVTDFKFEFRLPAARKDEYVRVDKDTMVVSAQSVEDFRKAVRDGLTFSASAS